MKKYRVWLLAIILTAFALRLYNLTFHSLWFDEAISVHWTRQSVPRIVEVGFTLVEDRLPPLYYLMLKGWTGLFGFSEFAVRGLSVFIGLLLVPVAADIGRRLFNRRIALVTAGLVALNPFLIWYAQEARMYAQAALFGTLSVWAFLRIGEGAKGRMIHPSFLFIALFILAAIAGLYSHLYTGFLLPALGLWLLISYPRDWKLWVTFVVSGLIITVAFLPQAAAIWRFSGEATPGNPLSDLEQRAVWLLTAFTIWKAPLSSVLQMAIPTTIALFALLAFFKDPTQSSPISVSHPLLLTTLLLMMPFLIANILLVRNYLAFFGERYFIVMVPWLLLLAAIGADKGAQWLRHWGLSRPLSLLPVGLVILATVWPLPGQWSGPAAKEFWRQSVAYLARYATPDDGILIHPDWVRYPFQFYFDGPGQTYAAFSDVDAATPLDGPLQGIVGDHAVVWLIQSHLDGPDPNHLVEQWFASRYPLITELYPPGIALKGYAPGYQLERLPAEVVPLELQFKNGMQLVGYQADTVASATDQFFHPPSGWVHLTLYWTASQPITDEVQPYAHLIGPEGVWGINLNRANDALRLYPPSRWAEAKRPLIVRHDLDINLNPLTPPGRYQLVVGLEGYKTEYILTEVEIQ